MSKPKEPRPVKVFSWIGHNFNTNRQTTFIVVAETKKMVAHIAGYSCYTRMHNLGETCNDEAIAAATSKPGTIFARTGGVCVGGYEEYIRNENK